jgi:hypothetical protein
MHRVDIYMLDCIFKIVPRTSEKIVGANVIGANHINYVHQLLRERHHKMRYPSLLYPFLAAILTVTAVAQQKPILNSNPGPVIMPPAQDSPSTSKPADSDTVVLSDVLGRDRSINIFAGFTRDFATVTERFEDSSLNTTILAPVNSAIMALPRKPWEDPEDYDRLGPNAYEGDDGAERAHRNVRKFVEAHVVPASPWEENDKVKTLAGGEIWWESKDGVRMVGLGLLRMLQRWLSLKSLIQC